MVDQHTPGGDEDRAGLSASSDAPMSRVHAHARTHEADPTDGPANPHPPGDPAVLAAGGWPVALIDPASDRGIVGLALSLVQDIGELIGNSEGVAGLHMNGDVAPWASLTEGGEFGAWLGSFDRLRDALDKRFPVNASPVKIMDTEGAQYEQTAAGDLVAFGSRPGGADEPVLTLVVNGVEYRTTSTSVRGKLGGCPIRAEWDGATSLRIHLDTPGYVPPPTPPIIYGSAGLGGVPVDEEPSDPAATVRTIEAAVAGGLIPGMDPEVLSALRQSHDGAA